MARDQIKEVRRVQLIEATIGCLARTGFSDLTIAEVAATAKLSTGIVNFYFKSKDALLAATLQHMSDEYRRYWRGNVEQAPPSPVAKITAMLEGDFQRLVAASDNFRKPLLTQAFTPTVDALYVPLPNSMHLGWAIRAAEAMLARANRLYAELGRKLEPIAVGSSADASLAAATGTPTLDGFGMEGDGAHSVDDQAHFDTLAPRAYLLARMLMDVGHDPKGK